MAVAGEAGIGKTTLVRRFADEGEMRVLWAGCDDLTVPEPLAPIRDVAAQVGGVVAAALDSGRLTRDNVPVGEITIRPQGDRITADGAVELVRKQTRLAHKGKTVTANLAVKLDGSLAGQTLEVEVEATDTSGHRQLERDAGTVRVAP